LPGGPHKKREKRYWKEYLPIVFVSTLFEPLTFYLDFAFLLIYSLLCRTTNIYIFIFLITIFIIF